MKKYRVLKEFDDHEVDAIVEMDEAAAKGYLAGGLIELIVEDNDLEKIAGEEADAILKAVDARIKAAQKEFASKHDALVKAVSEKASNFHVEVGDDNTVDNDPKQGFEDFGEYTKSVIVSSKKGNQVDERLVKIEAKAAQGNNTLSGADGGFLIPPEFSNRLIERQTDQFSVLQHCDKITMSSNSLTINGCSDHDKNGTSTRYGGLVVYWVAEADQITKSSLKFRKVTLTPHKLGALVYVTEEEMSDSAINFGQRLSMKASEAINDEINEAVMFGTGVGKPMGAFGSAACVSQAKETGQAADTIVAENIINMNSIIWDQSAARGFWYYNPECLPQLETMALSVGTAGVPAYWPAGGLTANAPAMIKGRPAFRTDHMLALGDAGDIGFADWGQYLLATRGTVNTAMSTHLRFDYDEVAFKFTFRVDGRPSWDTTLRPRKGVSTRRVAPFVKLATR